MGFLDKVKRGLAETIDKESRGQAAAQRDLERTEKVRNLKDANAMERLKRREMMREGGNYSLKELVKSKYREAKNTAEIDRTINYNRDVMGAKVKSGGKSILKKAVETSDSMFDDSVPRRGGKSSDFKMDFGIDIDAMLGTKKQSSQPRRRYEPVFNKRGQRIGSRMLKAKKPKKDPWDIDIGF